MRPIFCTGGGFEEVLRPFLKENMGVKSLSEHIFFKLDTEQEVLTFLSLGGMALLDPSRTGESINSRLLDFLDRRGISVSDVVYWRDILSDKE